jgi:hypothetical protein
MIACASLALDVPRRNLRSFSLVSGENEYSRESDYHKLASDGEICEQFAWPMPMNLVRGDISPFWPSTVGHAGKSGKR